MRLTVAYYLLLFYAAALLKPVIPLVADFVAHRFAHAHHIATVHKQHGANHVHTELAATADEQDGKQAPKQKTSEPISVHTVTKDHFQIFTWPSGIEYNVETSPGIGKPALQVIFPPPRLHFLS